MPETNYNEFWRNNESHYNHPSVKLRYKFIKKSLQKLSFNSLLDVGCGDGVLLNDIKHNFFDKQLAGTDISSTIININKQKIEGVSFFESDISQKNINSDLYYDVIVCSEVIEHLNAWKTAIKNLYALNNSNGFLLLTTQSGKIYKSDINVGHVQHFKLKELIKYVEESGYTIIKAYKKGFPFYNIQKILYQIFENRAKSFQTGKTGHSNFGKIIFKITYFLFLLSPVSTILGPQIFILAKKT